MDIEKQILKDHGFEDYEETFVVYGDDCPEDVMIMETYSKLGRVLNDIRCNVFLKKIEDDLFDYFGRIDAHVKNSYWFRMTLSNRFAKVEERESRQLRMKEEMIWRLEVAYEYAEDIKNLYGDDETE